MVYQSAYVNKNPMLKLSTWGNCGCTTDNILGILGNDVTQIIAPTNFTHQDADFVHHLIMQPRHSYTFIEITIAGIHEFILDYPGDGGVCLVQGYAGSYNAFWWCGASVLDANVSMTPIAEAWGKGADISHKLVSLAENLRNLLCCATWNGRTRGGTSARDVWRKLPFQPNDQIVQYRYQGTDTPITFKIRRFIYSGAVPIIAGQNRFAARNAVYREAANLHVLSPW